MSGKPVLVTGAGGFIGHHLVTFLKRQGYWVRGVDIKQPEYEPSRADEFEILDLRRWEECLRATRGVEEVYALAADMGGMGYIAAHHAEILHNNLLISVHTLEAARANGARRYLYTSSACIYPEYRQTEADVVPLREEHAYPAQPQDAYGWEKLITERLCAHYGEEYGMETRIVRFHNIFGPCFDEETEILTRVGFKRFPDLTYDDEIATRNPDTGLLEYQRPVAIQRYDYQGPMHRIANQRIDLLITPDHSVYYTTKGNGGRWLPWRLDKVQDVWDRAVFWFRRDAQWRGEDRAYFVLEPTVGRDGRSMYGYGGGVARAIEVDTWLRFMGWYLSEGSYTLTDRNHIVAITQYDPQVRAEIADVVRSLGFVPYENGNNVRIFSKQLYEYVEQFGRSHEKHIPRDVLDLPPDRLRVLFESLMAGDGDKDKKRYSTTSRQLADDVVELAVKLGYGTQISQEVLSNDTVIYRVHVSTEVIHKVLPRHRSIIEDWSGLVYDVTVPNHIIFVRRNGKTVWSGNCGTWDGGREKAPAAMCRKVATAKLTGNPEVEIWGDGQQTRSFCYIDDCIAGIYRLMRSNYAEPLNLGQDRLISINDLADTVAALAGVRIVKKHIAGPQGVRGRNSDNTRLREVLGWEPQITLEEGLARTYAWVEGQVIEKLGVTTEREVGVAPKLVFGFQSPTA